MLDMRFHPDVEQEVDSAYAWYETQVAGLGEDFLHELENGLASVQTMPETWTVVAPRISLLLVAKISLRHYLPNRSPRRFCRGGDAFEPQARLLATACVKWFAYLECGVFGGSSA